MRKIKPIKLEEINKISDMLNFTENQKLEFKKLMIELKKHSRGVGLSAVQIGILQNVFIMKVGITIEIVINPSILKRSKSQMQRRIQQNTSCQNSGWSFKQKLLSLFF